MGKKMFVILLFTVFFLLLSETGISSTTETETPLATYVGDSGITIVSFSENWTEKKALKSIHDELLNNGHGDEIQFLSHVYLYGYEMEDIASYYFPSYNKLGESYYFEDACQIELYNCDNYTTVSDMARYLSHEYGHHFTFYYLMTKEGLLRQEWSKSDYAKQRMLSQYESLTFIGDLSKPYVYEWDIAEIIANDYVQLYGSSLARNQEDYLDVKERLELGFENKYYYDNQNFNILPQDNMRIPLVTDNPDMYDYFYQLTGVRPIGNGKMYYVAKPSLTKITNVYKGYNQYAFKWQMSKNGAYNYTLIINPLGYDDAPRPLKTVNGLEIGTAYGGSAIDLSKDKAILENLEGDYEIRMLMSDENGLVHSSDVVTIRITRLDNTRTTFNDIKFGYWAMDYIYDIYDAGLIKGYPDLSFKPEGAITVAEFVTILVRSETDVTFVKKEDSDWFSEEGYEAVGLSMGLISETDDVHRPITRVEMAKMVYNRLKAHKVEMALFEQVTFNDVTKSDDILAVESVASLGIIEGYPGGTFKPGRTSSRAEAMTILSRYLDYN